jgi:Type IV Pilus-assembly protein W
VHLHEGCALNAQRVISAHRRLKNTVGFTLIETLIGLSIGLVILGAVTYALNSGNLAQRSGGLSTLAQDGQIALNLITQQLQLAGYSKPRINTDQQSASRNYSGLAVRGCDNGRFSNGIGVNTEPVLEFLTCPTNSVSGGSSGKKYLTRSSIAVAYEADIYNTVATRTIPNRPVDCLGQSILDKKGIQLITSKFEDTYRLANNRFFIDTDIKAGQINLYCAGNGGGDPVNPDKPVSWTPAPLISGVEDMVLSYGLMPIQANSLGQNQYQTRIERYVTASELDDPVNNLGSTTYERWARVGAVRVCLIMMSTEANAALTSTPYRDCSGALITPTDKRLRLAVQGTVALRNKL